MGMLCLLAFTICVTIVHCVSDDWQKLDTIFNNVTNLPQWWHTSSDICDGMWSSIQCNNFNRLESLNLSYLSLYGTINAIKWPLTLKYLYLNNNQLSGTFNISLLPLKTLMVCDITNNDFTNSVDFSSMLSINDRNAITLRIDKKQQCDEKKYCQNTIFEVEYTQDSKPRSQVTCTSKEDCETTCQCNTNILALVHRMSLFSRVALVLIALFIVWTSFYACLQSHRMWSDHPTYYPDGTKIGSELEALVVIQKDE